MNVRRGTHGFDVFGAGKKKARDAAALYRLYCPRADRERHTVNDGNDIVGSSQIDYGDFATDE